MNRSIDAEIPQWMLVKCKITQVIPQITHHDL